MTSIKPIIQLYSPVAWKILLHFSFSSYQPSKPSGSFDISSCWQKWLGQTTQEFLKNGVVIWVYLSWPSVVFSLIKYFCLFTVILKLFVEIRAHSSSFVMSTDGLLGGGLGAFSSSVSSYHMGCMGKLINIHLGKIWNIKQKTFVFVNFYFEVQQYRGWYRLYICG